MAAGVTKCGDLVTDGKRIEVRIVKFIARIIETLISRQFTDAGQHAAIGRIELTGFVADILDYPARNFRYVDAGTCCVTSGDEDYAVSNCAFSVDARGAVTRQKAVDDGVTG
jgi:hypothetical protein